MKSVFHRFYRLHSWRLQASVWQTVLAINHINHKFIMDNAVSLVRAYFQLNGYFVVTDYPLKLA